MRQIIQYLSQNAAKKTPQSGWVRPGFAAFDFTCDSYFADYIYSLFTSRIAFTRYYIQAFSPNAPAMAAITAPSTLRICPQVCLEIAMMKIKN